MWDTVEGKCKNFFLDFTCHQSGVNVLQHGKGITYFPISNNSHASTGLKKVGADCCSGKMNESLLRNFIPRAKGKG